MSENEITKPRGLPGGIALPAVILFLSFGLFVTCTINPELIDLGPHFNPAGIGVIGASCSMFWLLIAIAKRPPPQPPQP